MLLFVWIGSVIGPLTPPPPRSHKIMYPLLHPIFRRKSLSLQQRMRFRGRGGWGINRKDNITGNSLYDLVAISHTIAKNLAHMI